MLIFGTRTKTVLVAVLFSACYFCRATVAQRLYRRRSWFALFFIPIFPMGYGKEFIACAHCGQSTPLNRLDAERFTVDAAHQQAQRNAVENFGLG